MPTSPEFLKACTTCKAFCCTAVMPLLTKQEKNKILAAGFNDSFIEIEKGIYTIKSSKDHTCPYLTAEYSCKIQNVKPKLCKTWPVIPRYEQHKRTFMVIQCPLYPSLSKQEIQQAKKEAATIKQRIVLLLWSISPDLKQEYKRFQYEAIK